MISLRYSPSPKSRAKRQVFEASRVRDVLLA